MEGFGPEEHMGEQLDPGQVDRAAALSRGCWAVGPGRPMPQLRVLVT